jgi:GNAT superfamily N-acetyltransferase
VDVTPLSVDRWDDLEQLFRSAAIPNRCWCQWWRRKQSEAIRDGGEGNKTILRGQVEDGVPLGMLAYIDGQAVGWSSLSPRAHFGRLARSPALTPKDGPAPEGTWSTVCFFVHGKFRHRDVARTLLAGAVEHARDQGATAMEGYPVRPRDGRLDNNSAFPGTHSMFAEAGFHEVESGAPGRSIQMIMRRVLV